MNKRIRNVIGFGIAYVIIKWLIIVTIGSYLYSTGNWSNWYFLLIPVIGLLFFNLVGKKIFRINTIPRYARIFNQAIQKHYPDDSAAMQQSVWDAYLAIKTDTNFALTSKNPIDKRLDFCSYFLALIKTLDAKGESFPVIRSICLEIVTEYVRPKNKFQSFVKRLVPQLITTRLARQFLKSFNRKVSKNDNPDGFIATIITDKQETFGLGYGVDILECGICKLFHKHNYYKYASILCEVDEITSAMAGLKLIRTGTIANGAKKCDFRFVRKNN